MLQMYLTGILAAEREREIREMVRVRRLLQRDGSGRDDGQPRTSSPDAATTRAVGRSTTSTPAPVRGTSGS